MKKIVGTIFRFYSKDERENRRYVFREQPSEHVSQEKYYVISTKGDSSLWDTEQSTFPNYMSWAAFATVLDFEKRNVDAKVLAWYKNVRQFMPVPVANISLAFTTVHSSWAISAADMQNNLDWRDRKFLGLKSGETVSYGKRLLRK